MSPPTYLVLHLTQLDFIIAFVGWLLRLVFNWYKSREAVNHKHTVGVATEPFALGTYWRINRDLIIVSFLSAFGLLFIVPELVMGAGALFGAANLTWNTGFSGLVGVLGYDLLSSMYQISRNRLTLLETRAGCEPSPDAAKAEEYDPATPPGGTNGLVPCLLLLVALGLGACAGSNPSKHGHRPGPTSLVGLLDAKRDTSTTRPLLPVVATDSPAPAPAPVILPAPAPSGGLLRRIFGGGTKYKNVTVNYNAGAGNLTTTTQTKGKGNSTAAGPEARNTAVGKAQAATTLGDGSNTSDASGATNAAQQTGGEGNKQDADQKAKGTAKKSVADALLTPTGYAIAVIVVVVVAGAIWYFWGYLPRRKKRTATEDGATTV